MNKEPENAHFENAPRASREEDDALRQGEGDTFAESGGDLAREDFDDEFDDPRGEDDSLRDPTRQYFGGEVETDGEDESALYAGSTGYPSGAEKPRAPAPRAAAPRAGAARNAPRAARSPNAGAAHPAPGKGQRGEAKRPSPARGDERGGGRAPKPRKAQKSPGGAKTRGEGGEVFTGSHTRPRRYSVAYLVKTAFVGMWRNLGMTLASTLVLLACLVVTGSFYALIVNLNVNLQGLGDLNQIVVYINEDYTEAQVEEIRSTVEGLQTAEGKNAVKGASIVTKAQTLAQEKAKYAAEYPQLFATLTDADNPYRDSLVITYASGADVAALEQDLSKIEGIENVVSRADVAETVDNLKGGISVVFAGFMVILFVVTLFVIIMTIRLAVFSRMKEISIMRYVGATPGFIMTPFILEGVFIGVFTAILAFFVENALYRAVAGFLTGGYDILQVVPFQSIALQILGSFVLIGVTAGAVGSWISQRRYLKA